MENKSYKKLTYEEYNRVLDCIYDFCKKLDIQNVQKNMWKLDFFTSNKDDQIMVQRISNRAEKINENIIGGYTAVLPFYINFQSGAKTEKSVKKITDVLDDLANQFEMETMNKFENIVFPDDIVPQKLEMIANPGVETYDNGIANFSALYQLIYYKKGAFE